MPFNIILTFFENRQLGNDHIITPLWRLLANDVYQELSCFFSDSTYPITNKADQHGSKFIIEEQRIVDDIAQKLNQFAFSSPVVSGELVRQWNHNLLLKHFTVEFFSHCLEVLNDANGQFVILDKTKNDWQDLFIQDGSRTHFYQTDNVLGHLYLDVID